MGQRLNRMKEKFSSQAAPLARALAANKSVKAYVARAGAQLARAGEKAADKRAGATESSVVALGAEGLVVVCQVVKKELSQRASEFEREA